MAPRSHRTFTNTVLHVEKYQYINHVYNFLRFKKQLDRARRLSTSWGHHQWQIKIGLLTNWIDIVYKRMCCDNALCVKTVFWSFMSCFTTLLVQESLRFVAHELVCRPIESLICAGSPRSARGGGVLVLQRCVQWPKSLLWFALWSSVNCGYAVRTWTFVEK